MRWYWLAFAVLVVALPTATAETTGPCKVEFAGVDLSQHDSSDTGQPIRIAPGQEASYRIESDVPLRSFGARIRYAFAEYPFSGEVNGTDTKIVAGTIPTDRYENVAGGLYRVEVEATRTDGTTCHSTALVHIEGPFLNAFTATASAVGLVGLWSIWTSVLQMIAQSKDYVDAVKDYREGRKMA